MAAVAGALAALADQVRGVSLQKGRGEMHSTQTRVLDNPHLYKLGCKRTMFEQTTGAPCSQALLTKHSLRTHGGNNMVPRLNQSQPQDTWQ